MSLPDKKLTVLSRSAPALVLFDSSSTSGHSYEMPLSKQDLTFVSPHWSLLRCVLTSARGVAEIEYISGVREHRVDRKVDGGRSTVDTTTLIIMRLKSALPFSKII